LNIQGQKGKEGYQTPSEVEHLGSLGKEGYQTPSEVDHSGSKGEGGVSNTL